MIDTITNTELTDSQKEYLEYRVLGIKEKDLLKEKGIKTVNVCIEFKDIEADKLPSNPDTISMNLHFDYIQATDEALTGFSFVDKNNNDVADLGDIIKSSDEEFYIMKNDNGEIRALAKWNLHAGNMNDGATLTPMNGLAIQSSIDGGTNYYSGTNMYEYPFYGVGKFANSAYWNTDSSVTIDLRNKSNLINSYLQEYRVYLNEKRAYVKDITLITNEELKELGCDYNSSYKCLNAPFWVSTSSYWTKTGYNNGFVSTILANSTISSGLYNNDTSYGIRPVIIINSSELNI